LPNWTARTSVSAVENSFVLNENCDLAATPVTFVTGFRLNRPIPPKKAARACFLTLLQSLALAKVSAVAVLWRLDGSPGTTTKAGSKADRTVKGQGQ